MTYIWITLNQPGFPQPDTTRVLKKLELRLKDQHQQLFFAKIWDHNVKNGSDSKLRFYRLFKSSYSAETYLSNITSFKRRQILTKFRISNHKLRIETGRYSKEKISERVCSFCACDSPEDELHLLFKCKLYGNIRNTFFSFISSNSPKFISMSEGTRVQYLMSPQDFVLANSVARFLTDCVLLRDRSV